MGMSTHVVFLRDKEDKQYKKYLAVFLACKKAKVEPPKEIDEYFGGDGSDNDPEYPLEIDADDYLREWGNDYSSGYEIDIDKIPEGVKTIRFYNSW